MNIIELLDLLASTTKEEWLEASEDLLEAGFIWELTISKPNARGNLQEVYRLIDLGLSSYFN